MTRASAWKLGWVALGLLGATSCTSTGVGNPSIGQREQALIDDGNEAMRAGDTSSSLNSIVMLGLRDQAAPDDSESLASLAETRTPLYFQPSGCLSTQRTDATVTFEFDGCRTGAFGLFELSGSMEATYSLELGSSFGVTVRTTPAVQIAGTTIELDSESVVTVTDEASTIIWNGRYRAERALRADIEHESAYTAVLDHDTQCLGLDGSATTLFGGEDGVETFVTDYSRCGPRGTCPSSGELSLTALPDRDRSLTLDYDGDDTAWVPELEQDVAFECRP